MPDLPLRYPSPEASDMAVRLHRFESSRVAGPGSSRRCITDVLWTRREAVETLGLDEEGTALLDELLESLLEQRNLMIVPEYDNGEDGMVTRTAETLRMLGHSYEYWMRGRPGIDATRWEVVPKLIPRRFIDPSDFTNLLIDGLEDGLGMAVHGTNLGRACEEVVRGVASQLAGDETRFSQFQLDAAIGGVLDAEGADKKGSILVAGVGSGKTIAFMLPPLILARRDILEGSQEYKAHMFLYPRTALALDQFSKSLVPFAVAAGIPLEQIHSEMSLHYRNNLSVSVRRGIKDVHNSNNQPRLVISTLETLKRRLAHPIIVKYLLRRLQSVTIDEVHLVSGVQGAQVAMLLRRLREIAPWDATWTGASATIAKPEEHLGRLIGENPKRLRLIFPSPDEMVPDGVVHHCFIRPSGLISTAGALTNATSLLVHSRRDDLSDRPRNRKQRLASPKTIAFADNLELLGRWNTDFRENERTDVYDNGRRESRREHPDTDDLEEWGPLQRELPYAMRFAEPLQRRIDSEGGISAVTGDPVLLPVLDEWRSPEDSESVCQRCKNGERFELGDVDADTMRQIGTIPYRAPHDSEDDNFASFLIDNPVFSEAGTVGTLDMCPFLKAGACTWFSNTPIEEPIRIGNRGGTVRWDFAGRATSRIQSSKSESNEEAEDLSDAVFEATYEELHNVRGAVGKDFVNAVFASPSLEVGVDLPNLTESIMHKAVRNIASYRQKVGRVGREPMSEALNITLATDSPLDLHYYRQPRKLVDRGRLEPVPLKEKNEAVARSTAYLSVWDWLCNNCVIPEDLMSFRGGEFAVRSLQDAVLSLDDRADEVKRHVVNVLNDDRYNAETDWIEDARQQVLDEIRILLRPVSGYSFDPPMEGPNNCIAAMIHMLGSGRSGARAVPMGQASQDIREFDDALNRASNRRRDCSFIETHSPELLARIDRLLVSKSPSLSDVDDVLDAIADLDMEDRDEIRRVRRLERPIDEIRELVDRLESSGVETDSFRLIEEYQRLSHSEGSWRRFYLSDTIRALDCFKELRRNDWFVSPEALFIHPHMDSVALRAYPPESIRDDQSVIPLEEALHSYLPGMWTSRLPQALFKVAARVTEPLGEGSVLLANLDNMEQRGLKVHTIERALPAPPGRPDDRTIRVVTPTEIPIIRRRNPRYVLAETNGQRILDSDEGEPRGYENRPIRIPRSFTNRWLHVDLEPGEPIGPYHELGDGERLITTSPDGRVETDVGPNHLEHPFQRTAFESVEWHDEATVVQYVFGLNRTISTDQGYGSELVYADGYGGDIAFGSKITTEGIAFGLHPEIVSRTVEDAISGISQGKPEWGPTMIRALRSHFTIEAARTGGALSSFDIEDVISILLAGWRDEGGTLSVENLVLEASSLLEDSEILEGRVTLRVDARLGTPDEEEVMTEADAEARTRAIERMMGVVRRTLANLSEGPDPLLEFLPLWLHRSIMMSFGVTAVTALQRMSGADSGEVGYGLTPETWTGEQSKVVIFDRAERGNGNVAVAKTFMHIPNIIRSSKGQRGALLPTMDFMSTLEETLLPCPQHHSDLLGLEYRRTGGEDSQLHSTLFDLRRIGQEVFRVAGDTWGSLGVDGPSDGWRLPLLHPMRREVALTRGLAKDDVVRATKVCWNGCPECVDRVDVVQGGSAGLDYLDRMLLDSWFRISREATEDYHHINLDSMVQGETPLQLGKLHTLALRTHSQRLRSTTQPWIVGADVSRSNPDRADLVIRESDIVGMRTGQTGGVIVGTPATGVKRLLWFDLLASAFLDISGKIPEDRRQITLVFYDAREVSFDDVGIAPRFLEALREAAREDGMSGGVETLSDVLIWLARRGFEVRLCIDAGVRSLEANAPVREFLKTLSSANTGGNLKLLEREVIDPESRRRNMHKKILVTPIYALSGSANLTYSGTSGNEEIEAHIMYGDPNYDSVRTGCEDTIAMARPVEL